MFGYSAEEATGCNLRELVVPPDQRGQDHDVTADVVTSGSTTYESLRQHKDGSPLYVTVSCKAIRSRDGAIQSLLYIKKDVTHLKCRRDAKLVEARFGKLLESIPDGIVIVNAAGRVVLANVQAEQMFGYSPNELSGVAVELLMPEQFRKKHVKFRAEYARQPRKRAMGAKLELFGLRKDSTEFPVEISLSPLALDEGTLIMSVIRDVSERQRAARKFRDLLEAAPDATVIVDREGKIVRVNAQAETVFGYDREELINREVEVLIPDSLSRQHRAHRHEYFADAKFRPMGVGLELNGVRKSGEEFPVEISLSPLETEEGTLVSAAIRDITERKRIDRKLQEKNEELAMALRSRDQFLANMSHELRTPLNAIIGFAGTLLMKLPGPLTGDQTRQLKTIQASAHHLLSLINDLLDMAKIDSGKFELEIEPVNCSELLNEVTTILKAQAEEKNLKFVLACPESEIVVQTDRRILSQILLNLVGNAVKFTDRGSIELSVAKTGPRAQQGAAITIKDTGSGISHEDLARVFEPFVRLNRSANQQQGTGLGLHVSRKLAGVLGGSISVESQLGKGSSFTLILEA